MRYERLEMSGPHSSDLKCCQALQTGGPAHEHIVPLLLSTDAEFLQHAAVCLTSLLVNNPKLFFDIVIVSRPIQDLDEEKLRRSLRRFSNYSLALLKFEPPANRLPLFEYTLDTWTRLWMEEFFPKDVDRVLYLDVDIVVVGGIASLWRTDLEGALLGAVDIPGGELVATMPGFRRDNGYFNAGVLIIDLKQWRDIRALETVLAYVDKYPDNLPNVDQDALNACFHDRRKRLEYKWNVIRPFFREPSTLPLPRYELEVVCREARIIHFNGSLKPWSYFSDHPRKDEYERYLRMTEWRDFVPPDRTPINIIRKGVAAILPSSVKGIFKTIGSRLQSLRAA
jgi:lipopolysaccharide biosynthesis glycosyltransferase